MISLSHWGMFDLPEENISAVEWLAGYTKHKEAERDASVAREIAEMDERWREYNGFPKRGA